MFESLSPFSPPPFSARFRTSKETSLMIWTMWVTTAAKLAGAEIRGRPSFHHKALLTSYVFFEIPHIDGGTVVTVVL